MLYKGLFVQGLSESPVNASPCEHTTYHIIPCLITFFIYNTQPNTPQTCCKSSIYRRHFDKLQQSGKIDNLQQVCDVFGCVHYGTIHYESCTVCTKLSQQKQNIDVFSN